MRRRPGGAGGAAPTGHAGTGAERRRRLERGRRREPRSRRFRRHDGRCRGAGAPRGRSAPPAVARPAVTAAPATRAAAVAAAASSAAAAQAAAAAATTPAAVAVPARASTARRSSAVHLHRDGLDERQRRKRRRGGHRGWGRLGHGQLVALRGGTPWGRPGVPSGASEAALGAPRLVCKSHRAGQDRCRAGWGMTEARRGWVILWV